MINRLLLRCAALWLALPVVLLAFRPISVSEVNGEKDVAIDGYDTVAYFTEGEAVRGRAIFRHEWQGAFWYFSNASHRASFAEDPERYAPAYGGYCGYCVSHSKEAATGGNPSIFLIHNDRLYLLQSEELLKEWQKDMERYTKEADAIYAALSAEGNESAQLRQE